MVDDRREQPTADHVLAALARFEGQIRKGLERRSEEANLRLRGSEGRLLDLIGPDGSRPTTLAAGAWITKQAIGKRLRDLEGRGLVRFEADPEDGRAVLVHRTPEGERVRGLALDGIADLERELAELVGPIRYRRFRAVLDELGEDR
jgi:DNA-binding MarR family transcriptional regulator